MTLAADISEGAVRESARAAPSLFGSGSARGPLRISVFLRKYWVVGPDLRREFQEFGHLLAQGAGRDTAQEEHGAEPLGKILLRGLFQEDDGFGADIDDHVAEALLTAEIERNLELLKSDVAEVNGESLSKGGIFGLLEVLKASNRGLARP